MPSRHAIFVVFAATFALVARVDVRADTEPNFARGVKSYDAKKYREAIGHFQSHLNLHACSLGLQRIGDCYYGLSEFASALTQYTAAIDRGFTPASTIVDAPVSYTINGHEYTIRSGESQWLLNDRDWEIEFDRGGDFGLARYSMSPGIYTFKLTKKGWEIFHDDDLSKLSVTTEAKGAKDNAQPPRPKDVE